jgi:hypothetical protein
LKLDDFFEEVVRKFNTNQRFIRKAATKLNFNTSSKIKVHHRARFQSPIILAKTALTLRLVDAAIKMPLGSIGRAPLPFA